MKRRPTFIGLISGVLITTILFAFAAFSYAETDVTSKVQLLNSALVYDRRALTSSLDVSLKNVASDVLLTPIRVVIDSISDTNITVANQDGFTLDGKPYFAYTTPTGQLLSNTGLQAKKWVFSNPKAARFTYTFSVWGGIPDAAGTIGPAGGSLQVTDPNSYLLGLKIDIPSGALTENKLLLIREDTSPPPLPDGIFPAGPAIDFSPNGTVFNSNVRITVPYNDADNDGIVDYTGILPEDIKLHVFDETLNIWQELAIIGLDKVNHTATFETNHFSRYRPTAQAVPSGKNIFFFTIPGLSILRTIGDFFPTYFKYSGEFPDRPDYLQDGVLQLTKDLGLNYPDVHGFRWGGSAYDTPEVMDKLNQEIKDQYEKHKGKKFILVTHSWGTVLGILALQYNTEIKPDLFLTLSSPLGSDNITEYNNNLWLDLPGTILDLKVGPVQEVIYGYSLQQIERTRDSDYGKIDYGKWINYWAEGDIISGPLTPNYQFYANSSAPAVVDRRTYLFASRTIGTTFYSHALTSLDEKTWKDNSVNTSLGKVVRNYYIWKDIEDVILFRSISGRVFYSTTPLANVKIELIKGTDHINPPPPDQTTFTDSSGYFIFEELNTGNYFLRYYSPTNEYPYPYFETNSYFIEDNHIWLPHENLPKKMTLWGPGGWMPVSGYPWFCWEGPPESVAYSFYLNALDPFEQVVWKYNITETCYQLDQPLKDKAFYSWGSFSRDRYGYQVGLSQLSGSGFQYCLPGSCLKIAQTPMSGQPGTTFIQWGTGFTPNGTATLHFKKPDGSEYNPLIVSLDNIGHFEISYQAPYDKPIGTYTWWAIDDSTGIKSNEVSYIITLQPIIAQQPISGHPGTTFVQWGTGFTANGTATLHFRKPDGSEYPTQNVYLDNIGHFEISYQAPYDKPIGTYTWWAIDDNTGIKSNEVSYTIQ